LVVSDNWDLEPHPSVYKVTVCRKLMKMKENVSIDRYKQEFEKGREKKRYMAMNPQIYI